MLHTPHVLLLLNFSKKIQIQTPLKYLLGLVSKHSLKNLNSLHFYVGDGEYRLKLFSSDLNSREFFKLT